MDTVLQQRLDEERASLLAKLELLEKKKNEELQNLKTSLIAEQQVGYWTLETCLCMQQFSLYVSIHS